MDNKKHNAFLIILLVIFVCISLALGSFLFYDKVLKNYLNNQNPIKINRDYDNYRKRPNTNNNNYVSKIDSSKYWIYHAPYDKNVLANSYDTAYETYQAKDIVVPYINIDSEDAKKANEEIKKGFDEAINVYNEGVENKTSFVKIVYEKFIDNNLASVNLMFGKGGTDVIRPDYYPYTFDLTTGKLLSFEELYQRFNLNKNQIERKIKEEITD